MNWRRISNRQWQSDCGEYYIQALRSGSGYTYAAVYNPDDRRHIGLGMYSGPNSVTNADQAKQACLHHQQQIQGGA